MKRQLAAFALRLIFNAVGLWLSVRLFGTGFDDATVNANIGAFLFAGLIFSLVNTIVRPVVIILSLPAILLTLGLFTIIVNGLMVYISLKLAPGINVTFWHAILAGLVMSLVNYIVSSAFELQSNRKGETGT